LKFIKVFVEVLIDLSSEGLTRFNPPFRTERPQQGGLGWQVRVMIDMEWLLVAQSGRSLNSCIS